MQDLDSNFSLVGILPVFISPGTSVLRDAPIIECDLGYAPFFAFLPERIGLIFGTRDQIAPHLRDLFDTHDEHPATQRSIARFIGDRGLEKLAAERVERRIRDYRKRKHLQLDDRKIPIVRIDTSAFRLVREQYVSYWEPDDVGHRAASDVQRFIGQEFGQIKIAEPWTREIRRAFESPNPRGRRFLSPGRSGIHFAADLDSAVRGILQHVLMYRAASNIADTTAHTYVATEWLLRGTFADMRDFALSDEHDDYELSQAIGDLVADRGLAGVYYRSRAAADDLNFCVFDPYCIVSGTPRQFVRIDMSNPLEGVTVEPLNGNGQRTSGSQ